MAEGGGKEVLQLWKHLVGAQSLDFESLHVPRCGLDVRSRAAMSGVVIGEVVDPAKSAEPNIIQVAAGSPTNHESPGKVAGVGFWFRIHVLLERMMDEPNQISRS